MRLEFGGRRPRGRVFGYRRSSSAASAPARLSPGPCRQVSDSSSHEINSAWNLESATLPLLLFSYNESSHLRSLRRRWNIGNHFFRFRNTLSHAAARRSDLCLVPCLDLETKISWNASIFKIFLTLCSFDKLGDRNWKHATSPLICYHFIVFWACSGCTFRGFPMYFQASAVNRAEIRPRPLPSVSFPSHHSLMVV